MTTEEKLHKAVWETLNDIKQERLVVPDDEWILINTPTDEKWRAIRYLIKLGAIKALEYEPIGMPLKLINLMNGRIYKPNAYKVDILQPKFDELYEKFRMTYRAVEHYRNEKTELMTAEERRHQIEELQAELVDSSKLVDESKINELSVPQDSRPFCIIDGKLGFLKFSKHGQKIKIGKISSQSFRMLSCLTEPFGLAKPVDIVFEAIREGVKYKSKSGIYTTGMDRAQKVKLIEYAIKELQKGNKLQGKLVFKWDDLKNKIWLEYLG